MQVARLGEVCGSLIALGVLALADGLLAPRPAQAVIARMYTLPFYSSSSISCGFGCYSGHEGTDYELGTPGYGGEAVAAAAGGTAKPCPWHPSTGYSVVIDHGGGHRTRYLHFDSQTLPSQRAVARGEIIGYEGNSGNSTDDHLHFETRHNATTFTCGKDGTAVDPYAPSTYMWQDNPPNHVGFSPAVTPWHDTFA